MTNFLRTVKKAIENGAYCEEDGDGGYNVFLLPGLAIYVDAEDAEEILCSNEEYENDVFLIGYFAEKVA